MKLVLALLVFGILMFGCTTTEITESARFDIASNGTLLCGQHNVALDNGTEIPCIICYDKLASPSISCNWKGDLK